MYNRAQFLKDKEASKKPKKLKKPKDVIVDPRGQWAFPGEITKIPSGNITMKGVPFPVLGVDNLGNNQMMQPGGDYNFPGSSVTEFPIKAEGGWLDSYKNGGPKLGQIYDRLGRLHSIKKYVPGAQAGGAPVPSYIAPPQYLMNNEDSTAYKTYFNRYLAGKADDRAQDLINTPLRPDLVPPALINKLLVEKNAYLDAMKQLAKKQDGGWLDDYNI